MARDEKRAKALERVSRMTADDRKIMVEVRPRHIFVHFILYLIPSFSSLSFFDKTMILFYNFLHEERAPAEARARS